jgi:hypothetical protein
MSVFSNKYENKFQKTIIMETIKIIVNGTEATLSHICNGKACFKIMTAEHSYQLEIDLMNSEWKDVYVYPVYKAITLMRWIRKGIENDDGSFILMK